MSVKCVQTTTVDSELLQAPSGPRAQIQIDLLDELQPNKYLYLPIYGNEDRIAKLEKMLNYFNDFPRIDHWMTFSYMGHLIVLRYKIVLILSQKYSIFLTTQVPSSFKCH